MVCLAFQMASHSANDAPPDYNSLFGGSSSTPQAPPPSAAAPPPHFVAAAAPPLHFVAPPTNIPEGSLHRGDVPPSLRTQARGDPEGRSSSFFCCKNKSAAIIGIYSFLFILGIFIPGTMIGLGRCVPLLIFILPTLFLSPSLSPSLPPSSPSLSLSHTESTDSDLRQWQLSAVSEQR